MRFPRCFASLAECFGQMYIVGGAWLDSESQCGNFSSVFDVDKFNDKSNVWEGVTALRVGRHDCGYAVLGEISYMSHKSFRVTLRFFELKNVDV